MNDLTINKDLTYLFNNYLKYGTERNYNQLILAINAHRVYTVMTSDNTVTREWAMKNILKIDE